MARKDPAPYNNSLVTKTNEETNWSPVESADLDDTFHLLKETLVNFYYGADYFNSEKSTDHLIRYQNRTDPLTSDRKLSNRMYGVMIIDRERRLQRHHWAVELDELHTIDSDSNDSFDTFDGDQDIQELTDNEEDYLSEGHLSDEDFEDAF